MSGLTVWRGLKSVEGFEYWRRRVNIDTEQSQSPGLNTTKIDSIPPSLDGTTAGQGLLLQSHAFPPSMEVRCRRYDYRDVIGRVESGTETESDAGSPSRGGQGEGENAKIMQRLTH
jgi:hypothetical protein